MVCCDKFDQEKTESRNASILEFELLGTVSVQLFSKEKHVM